MKFVTSLIAIACTAAATKIEAEILFRTDRDESIYEADNADFPFFFNYGCGATVVGRRFGVTAAHCIDYAMGEERLEPFPVTIDGQELNVVEVRINECYDSDEPGADIALLVFDRDVDVTPLEFWNSSPDADGDEVGRTFRMMGYGDYGPFSGGANDDRYNDVFHTAHNVVTSTRNNSITYVFDAPDDGALDDEGMSWYGDSGGPVLIMQDGAYKVAGVNFWGDCCTYGMEDQYSRTGDVTLEWLNANMESSDVGGKVAESRECSIYGGANDADDSGEYGDDYGEDGDDYGEDGDYYGEDGDYYGEDGDFYGEDGDNYGEDGDDYGEDADDYGEDADDEDADDYGEDADDEDADDYGEDADDEDADCDCEDADDYGEDADDEDADDYGEDADDEDADDYGEDADDEDADDYGEDADDEDADCGCEDADDYGEDADNEDAEDYCDDADDDSECGSDVQRL